MLNKLLDKLERKFGRFAIPHLMSIILVGMIVIFCADFLMMYNPNIGQAEAFGGAVSGLFSFDWAQIKAGQIWRLITFVFLPPSTSLLFAVFTFYFIWLIGIGLETQWGSFKFNVYYLTGIIGTIIAGCLTGHATNVFLNLSMFLAFAYNNPNFELLLFFFIPVRIKWLALLDAFSLLVALIFGSWYTKILLLISLLNLVLFFGKEVFTTPYYAIRRKWYQWKRKH